jgi:hypothetical protein
MAGWCNLELYNGNSAGDDCIDFNAGNVAGRGHILCMWGAVSDGYDEDLNIVQPPQSGMFFTFVGVHFPFETDTASSNRAVIVGNNPASDPDQHSRNAHTRGTMIRCDFGTRERHPNMNGAHLESMETRRRVLFNPIIIRKTEAMLRSRHDIWVGPPENPSNNTPIAIQEGAAVRVENAVRINDADMSAIAENRRTDVTDGTLYEDENGVSVPEYNDYTPGLLDDWSSLTDSEKEAVVTGFRGWFDCITLANGTLTAGALAGQAVTLTNAVDNWPALTSPQKEQLLDDATSDGPTWASLRAVLSASDIGIAGKVLTLTFPAGADAVSFSADEEITFHVRRAHTSRSADTQPEESLLIQSDSGGGGATHALNGTAAMEMVASGSLTLASSASDTIAIDVRGSLRRADERDIRRGGAVARLRVRGGRTVAQPLTLAMQQAIWAGLSAETDAPNGWNSLIRDALDPALYVTRISDEEVQIGPLPPVPEYDVSTPETINVSFPEEALN